MKLSINRIDPNPKQPRRRFEDLGQLAASIREKGLLEPIMVRSKGKRYEIIHGERRWRAVKMAGLTKIDAIVRKANDAEAFELALIENVQRQDLSPLEEAEAYKRLTELGMTQVAVGELVGKGQSYVAHKLRLLRIPPPIAFWMDKRGVTENHIRQALRLETIIGDRMPDYLVRFIEREKAAEDESDGAPCSFSVSGKKPRTLQELDDADLETILAGWEELAKYVSKHDPVPDWVVPATQALMVCWDEKATVADLRNSIDRIETNMRCLAVTAMEGRP